MSDQQVRMIVLSTDDLEESIKFYTEPLGFPLKFRDGAHFAALDGGSVTLALAPTTTLTSAVPWCTTTRATAWSSTSRFRADAHRSAPSAPSPPEIFQVVPESGVSSQALPVNRQ